jgi:hypothetical protein
MVYLFFRHPFYVHYIMICKFENKNYIITIFIINVSREVFNYKFLKYNHFFIN